MTSSSQKKQTFLIISYINFTVSYTYFKIKKDWKLEKGIYFEKPDKQKLLTNAVSNQHLAFIKKKLILKNITLPFFFQKRSPRVDSCPWQMRSRHWKGRAVVLQLQWLFLFHLYYFLSCNSVLERGVISSSSVLRMAWTCLASNHL